MRLNQYIKQRRIELGLTQVELAKKLGMKTNQQLCNFERGACAFPKNKLKKLRKVLRIDKAEMILRLLDDYELQIREWL